MKCLGCGSSFFHAVYYQLTADTECELFSCEEQILLKPSNTFPSIWNTCLYADVAWVCLLFIKSANWVLNVLISQCKSYKHFIHEIKKNTSALLVILFLLSVSGKFAFDGSVKPVVLSEIISLYFNCVISKIQDWNWDNTTNTCRIICGEKKEKKTPTNPKTSQALKFIIYTGTVKLQNHTMIFFNSFILIP